MNHPIRHQLQKACASLLTPLLAVSVLCSLPSASTAAEQPASSTSLQRQMEYLDRGLVAVKVDNGVFLSWRLLGFESSATAFNLFRDGVKVNDAPITASTNYVDPAGTISSTYSVRLNGKEQAASESATVWGSTYMTLPLIKPADGVNPDGSAFTYSANDASVGDLDGDGMYEIVLKWDPSNSKDNSQDGVTGEVYMDAYKLNGSRMWRIGLGKNIRAGAHYTQFMVYDLDGDGKAEIAAKTADGTTDGIGKVIGDANADYRNAKGRVLEGPEYLTIFDGQTGRELITTPYEPPRGKVTDWGDNYGNRVDRFLAAIAYLDGRRPSLVMARGYYTRTVLVAYNWRDGQLSKVWTFDSNDPGNAGYAGQGNHNLSVADVDGDGKDEIIYGACTIDDNGQGLYTTTLGHGDALHVGDLDPSSPGLEVFKVMESTKSPYGAAVWNAADGKVLWGVFTGKDTGRGMSADIDPRYPGEEVWASTGVGLYSIKGEKISSSVPSINFGIWWDDDPLRELLDSNRIDKWDYTNNKRVNLMTATGASSNNGTKATPTLSADLFGDWREEVVWRTNDSSALQIYTTTNVTDRRIHTLMHDPVYRLGVAWQNVAYNQPPHTSYYLGEGMSAPPAPNIYVKLPAAVNLNPNTLNLKSSGNYMTASIEIPLAALSLMDVSTVNLTINGKTIPAQSGKMKVVDEDHDGIPDASIKFDRQQIIQAVGGLSGSVQATVSGGLRNGHRFSGTGTFNVIR